MRYISIIFLFLTFAGYSQFCPFLGPDQYLVCGVGSTTLTADFSQCVAGSNPNQTTNYGVTNIPYVIQNNTGTSLTMSDDSQQGPFNIGFTFCFFGQTYTQFYVGSNGWVSFSPAQPTTFTISGCTNLNVLVADLGPSALAPGDVFNLTFTGGTPSGCYRRIVCISICVQRTII